MHDDEITRLTARLAAMRGPARLRLLVDLGQRLMARAWQTGIGSEAAKPDLDGAIAAMDEARGYLDEADTSRTQLEANLGMLLGGRALAYGGDAADREKAIAVLLRPAGSPAVQPAVRDGCRVILGQLYLTRATRVLLDPGTVMTMARGGAPPDAGADIDRAVGWLRRVLDGPPASAESGQMATMMLQAAESMRGLFGGGGLDLGGVITAMQGFQRVQQEMRRSGPGVPMPSIFNVDEMLRGDAIDYPAMVVPGPAPVAPEPKPVIPEPAPVRPRPSPVRPGPEPVPPRPDPERPAPERPAPARRAPERRASEPSGDLDGLRRTARDRLVRGAGTYTAILDRLRPGVPAPPVAVTDDLVALTTSILHRGGDRPGDRVLAAFALAQRSRHGPGGEWDDDPREAGRHLIAAGGALLDAPTPLVTAALTLAESIDDRNGDGAVLAALAERFAPVRRTLEDLGGAGLAYPRPGGAILLEGGRFRPVAEGAPLPRRVVAIGRRRLPVTNTTISYATTAAQLITVAARSRRRLSEAPVLVTGPHRVPGVFHPGATVLERPAPDVVLSRLDASLLVLGCAVTADGALELARPLTPPAIAAGRARGALVIVSPAAVPPALAEALLTAGCTGVIGWLRPVPARVADAAMTVLHDRLFRAGDEPAEAVRHVREWLRDPGRPPVPGLADGWASTFGRRDDDAPGHAGALVLHGV